MREHGCFHLVVFKTCLINDCARGELISAQLLKKKNFNQKRSIIRFAVLRGWKKKEREKKDRRLEGNKKEEKNNPLSGSLVTGRTVRRRKYGVPIKGTHPRG